MKTNQKYFVIAIIATITILVMAMVFGNYSYIEEEKFHSDYPVGSDTYMEDSLSYAHPSWSYERIQEELYGDSVIRVNEYNVYYEYDIINGDTILVDEILKPLR